MIEVNPPTRNTERNQTTSTPDAQLKADEDFARQLAEEEQLESRRSRVSSSNNNDDTFQTPQMPPRKPVVIAPRSPLEFEGDSDYEGTDEINCSLFFKKKRKTYIMTLSSDVGLTAAPSSNISKSNNDKPTADENIPYVIGDDDDSDSDDLVDIDEDDYPDYLDTASDEKSKSI